MSEDKRNGKDAPWELSYGRDGAGFNGDDLDKFLEHGSKAARRASNEQLVSSHLSQWNYNQNRGALMQGIEEASELVSDLVRENDERPMHVPDNDLQILQVSLRLDGNWKDDLTLDKEALAQIFKTRATSALEHLAKLLVRVQDTSSKVFITGDLNAGKSTLCNALLRKRLLPEDQLPCTNVFCEILEARENENVEQVHAIPVSIAATVKEAYDAYNILDQTTYQVFPLEKLNSLVHKNTEYSLLKIYIRDDQRPAESSLLRNGTADIALIDSPGLNMDSVQTTEVMSRQEEIDLVIFVVNAENQLTLSGKEFISTASKEKKLMFFVVNKFDHIKDKQRCKKLILDQIKEISPETYKQSTEFVHFISSEGVFIDDSNGNPDGSDPDDNDNDNENRHEPDPDFDGLENSLRNFVLKKRSLSKLLPAKTYLMKLLYDIEKISLWNVHVYKEEENQLTSELEELAPVINGTRTHCSKLTEAVDRKTDELVNDVYDFTKRRILSSLEVTHSDFPRYDGLSNIHDYIFRARQYIIDQIKSSVVSSELYARNSTQQVVNEINELAKNELGNDFMSDRVFQSDLMFSRKKHSLGKKLSVPFNVQDLWAPSWDGFLSYVTCGFQVWNSGVSTEPVKSHELTDRLGLSTYSINKYWTSPSLLLTSRIPALAVYSYGGVKLVTNLLLYGTRFFSWQSLRKISTSLLLVGSALGAAYIISDLPRALPINLSNNYRKKLHDLDYIHANADRISKEVREVLKIPTREVVKSCELVLDKKQEQKRKLEVKMQNNALSVDFFHRLAQRASVHRGMVEEINLEVD
ncbi:ABR195Cp [Eremothecium gossypii ATCC 10895]|uniref:ABR195Cp n=1 Tax=Eremothecium gossypii (strain ATCC 10895 / CBS 109.51 / FGSC 9923 / NRRL Y-1056) TaxID=284811 RepID=Q75D27_EREGS|nr:ABR195Cp [Eremothecium gossypii ATCC 10895]AAS50968.2 ABR195Cp [Eremothecium gossypii ATCC 10895]